MIFLTRVKNRVNPDIDACPDAKVILTVRDDDKQWFNSFMNFVQYDHYQEPVSSKFDSFKAKKSF